MFTITIEINVCICQKLYDEVKQRRYQIEEVNKFGGQFMKEAKVSGFVQWETMCAFIRL